MSDQSKLGLGQIITIKQNRDAVHVAVAPVVAGCRLNPAAHVRLVHGVAFDTGNGKIGVVDPFLTSGVEPGEKFWLFLYPGSITSLRHEWSHPSFPAEIHVAGDKASSEEWMRSWALRNIETGYSYADVDDEGKYQFALTMGETMSVGPNESARDEVNNEWWNHWEILTGKRGQRDEYFSCGC